MAGTYREFLDSREAFSAYEPTDADWSEFEQWLDSLGPVDEAEINAKLAEAWAATAAYFEPEGV